MIIKIFDSMSFIGTTLILIIALFFLYSFFSHKETFVQINSDSKKNEGFREKGRVPDGVLEEVIGEKVTYPTARNPFMNVLIDEIKNNPTRAEAMSVLDPSVAVSLEQFFKTQFTNDPTDVFGKTQSQRQFYVTPSTTVPNDVESYQNWLYKIPGKTCKEGGPCMVSGTEGAAIPWLNTSN
jgi:hypothetical protein